MDLPVEEQFIFRVAVGANFPYSFAGEYARRALTGRHGELWGWDQRFERAHDEDRPRSDSCARMGDKRSQTPHL